MNLQQIIPIEFSATELADLRDALEAAYKSVAADRTLNPVHRGAWMVEIDDLQFKLAGRRASAVPIEFTREDINVLVPALERGAAEIARARGIAQPSRIRALAGTIAARDQAAVPIEITARSARPDQIGVRSVQPVR